MKINDFLLKDNPFGVTPFLQTQIWAGLENLKNQFSQRIEFSLKTSPSSIILNFGEYGSGKTHAARYFSNTQILSAISKKLDSPPPLALHLNFPRVSNDSVKELAGAILSKIGLENLFSDLKEIKKLLEEKESENYKKMLRELVSDSEVERILNGLVDIDDSNFDCYGRLLFGNASNADLKALKLSKKITSGSDYCKLISGLINLLTLRTHGIKPRFSAVHIWLDEFEDIKTLNGKEQDALTSFLRNLIDCCPSYLVLFINFTLGTVNNLQDLTIYLGEALWSRVRYKIEFPETTLDDGVAYIRELLNQDSWRISDPQVLKNPFFPFTEESVKFLLENISPRTIRKINERFSLAIELALMEKKLKEIDVSFLLTKSADLDLNQ